jgi:hypothetical protein
MNPMQIISMLSVVAVFIPPPWGPIIAAILKCAPLAQGAISAVETIMLQADPALFKHLQEAAAGMGVSQAALAKALFAPHTLSTAETASISGAVARYHGGPKS